MWNELRHSVGAALNKAWSVGPGTWHFATVTAVLIASLGWAGRLEAQSTGSLQVAAKVLSAAPGWDSLAQLRTALLEGVMALPDHPMPGGRLAVIRQVSAELTRPQRPATIVYTVNYLAN